MTLRDGSPWVHYAGVYARQRAEEVARRHAELAAGKPITAPDVSLARRRAEEAHVRARRAQFALVACHWRSVEFHERATAAGFGDFFEHEYAAIAYRVASENEYSAANEAPDRNDSI